MIHRVQDTFQCRAFFASVNEQRGSIQGWEFIIGIEVTGFKKRPCHINYEKTVHHYSTGVL